ncbi:hypothetical protein GCK72_022303 [Caenorhabditis remanei]|uniref:Uncharacterized protein n=1 Tax=Caenorhabditis remanei TaxID=31234 RepID=A0A6A5FTP7_CAERE|nr:hypothetical protein GCK72_022303 [Caenorhabditis remanei]KAF1745856.1 hypothetical protein GCK72_022303 [Caenorhabditis remanei]
MRNENNQNNVVLQNDVAGELDDGDHQEENIENLNEELLEDEEQEDRNIVEDFPNMESEDSDGGSDAPNSRRGSRASSRSRGETTPDSSLSRPSSRNRYDLNLIPKYTPPDQPRRPALIDIVRTAIGIVCLVLEEYFVVFRFDNGEFAMLEKNEGNINWNVAQGMEIVFLYKDFVQEFRRMRSFITQITKRLPQTRKWRFHNNQFQLVFHYKQSAREIMRGLRECCRIDITSTENVKLRVPFSLRKSYGRSVFAATSDFQTGAAWCRLEMNLECKWFVYESYEDPNSIRPPTQRMGELQRPSVLNSSTYQPDDGSSQMPGRRSKPKTRKPSESDSDSDHDDVKWEDIAPVGIFVFDPLLERMPNRMSRSNNGRGRQENSDRERNHQRVDREEKWNRERIFGFNDRMSREEFPVENGYQRAQRRNFELEEIPRGESSSGGGQNGPNIQQSHQLDQIARNKGNGVSFFGRRNYHREGSSSMYRNEQNHAETNRGFDYWNLPSSRHSTSQHIPSLAVSSSAQGTPSNSGTMEPVKPNSAQLTQKIEDRAAKKDAEGNSAHVKSYESICEEDKIRKELFETVKAALRKEPKTDVTSSNKRNCTPSGNGHQDVHR